MIYIDNTFTNPYFNLALEEYLLKNFDTDIFMLWRNEKAIIVGKNQNTLSEINLEYVKQNDIAVVRRLTGGGAVFHDLGNLNFTFILKNEGEWFSNFEKFTTPVIDVLRSFGVIAELSGRNDITVDGKKVSGNAQLVYLDKILHHGTLLFSIDMETLEKSLNASHTKLQSKGIKSVKSRVTNIPIDIMEFRKKLSFGEEYMLTQADIDAVNKLVEEKYKTWDWNYGYSPKYSFYKVMYFSGGTIEFNIDVKNGIMEKVKIFGDFFAKCDVPDVENALTGIKHNEHDIKKVLNKFKLDDYFLGISLEELLICMGV